ncbi:MAG: ornithine carbamoyltransferase [Verrucomicrobiota bacterium JB022]|nr:ornithine carbamoyltransferase [Verrucomicrobiota bacterium JB022]
MARSFLQDTDFTRDEAEEIFQLAKSLKEGRGRSSQPRPLEGQTWALIFHKSSTRTRVSFEVGIHELGGHPMYLDQSKTQMGRGETVADTARVLSRYIHGIVIRTFSHDVVEELAREGTVPVVNALTDLLHPCQIYSDLFTLIERWAQPGKSLVDSLAGRKITFVGDCASNMAHSWILGAAHFGMQISLTGPEKYRPRPVVDTLLRQAGLKPTYEFTTDAKAAAKDADVVYTDVWVSMGDEAEKEARLRELAPYQVDATMMAEARPGAYFMHCLPAHEGEEVSAEVYQSPQSIVYDEAENRLHVQKAILCKLAEA